MGEIYQILEKSRLLRFGMVWDDLEARIGINMKKNAQNMGSNHDFYDFQFFCEFQKTQGTGDSGITFGAVPKAEKSDTSYRILIFLFVASFSFLFLRIS